MCSLFHASEEVSTDYSEVGLNILLFPLKNSTESERENAKGRYAEEMDGFQTFHFSSPLQRSSSSISRLTSEMPVRGDN